MTDRYTPLKTATPSPGGSAAPSALMRATALLTVRGAGRVCVGIVMDVRVAGRAGAVPAVRRRFPWTA
ncbi:hypothetical protein GCM10009548_54850 [Streptomyces malaysiensis subsp. malaysiensis]